MPIQRSLDYEKLFLSQTPSRPLKHLALASRSTLPVLPSIPLVALRSNSCRQNFMNAQQN